MGVCESASDKSLKKTSSVQNEKKIFRDKLESLNSENEIKTERLYSKKKNNNKLKINKYVKIKKN